MQLVILTGDPGERHPRSRGKMRSPLTCARWRNDLNYPNSAAGHNSQFSQGAFVMKKAAI
jgi:hypothetical protein